jgi:hypothetical protein
MPRYPRSTCGRGIIDGNLPTYKTKECVSTVISTADLSQIRAYFPWVGIEDFHYYHIKCPFSTEAGMHFVRDSNPTSPTYFWAVDVEGSAVSHTVTSGIMIRFSRGSKHGWLCVDPNCPYYNGNGAGTTISGNVTFNTSGVPYFYI